MRAVVRRGPQLILDDIAEPVPGVGQVRARPLCCGICGSDRRRLYADRRHRTVPVHQQAAGADVGLAGSPEEFAATLMNIADGRIDVLRAVTGEVGLDGVAAVFAARKDPDPQSKMVVRP